MIHINIREQRRYFSTFKCEVISENEQNKDDIRKFVATEDGIKLEEYLKNKAWLDDSVGETRVFLVKDSNNDIALFFSVKCGLLYEQYMYDSLEQEERDFVDYIIEAKQNHDNAVLEGYYEYGQANFKDIDKLFEIAEKRLELKNETRKLNEMNNTLKVSACYGAVEIQHFCKNEAFGKVEGLEIPIGFGVFWGVIVPHILKITELVGCKYLYLFAADNTDIDDVKKLVRYYKTALKFTDVEDVNIIKPEYDRNCYGLIQSIEDLKRNKEDVWREFYDL